MPEARDQVTFELYEVRQGYPDLMVAEVSGPRAEALREIQHYALVYAQDGPVTIREVSLSMSEHTGNGQTIEGEG